MTRSIVCALALLLATGLSFGQGLDGRLKQIRDTRSIAIAYRGDAAPFSFVDASKQPAGYSVELCRRVVSSIEQQIGVPGIQIKWVPATVQNRVDLVAKGQADMECGSTTVTLSRSKQVNFSSYTFIDGTGLLTRSNVSTRTLADLAGKRIGVIAGTTNEKALQAALKRRMISASIVGVKSREEGLSRLEAGTLDAFASDKVLLMGLAPKVKDPKAFTLLAEDLSFEPYAIVLPRNDDDFRLAVNTALSRIYRSDAIGELFQRWFGIFGTPGIMLEASFLYGAIPE
jgi:glutamate/aspartate transport system substrate-binding protein